VKVSCKREEAGGRRKEAPFEGGAGAVKHNRFDTMVQQPVVQQEQEEQVTNIVCVVLQYARVVMVPQLHLLL
jgi:hypothetical protein